MPTPWTAADYAYTASECYRNAALILRDNRTTSRWGVRPMFCRSFVESANKRARMAAEMGYAYQ